MGKLTKNFTLEECTKSATASRLGIDNNPSSIVVDRLKKICEEIMQPIRDKYKKPIIISSGYRNAELNRAVGGSPTSHHQYGDAIDFHSISDTREDNKVLFDLVKEMIDEGEIVCSQLICEHKYDWIHISQRNERTNKVNQILYT